MTKSFECRQALLAGYDGQFQSDGLIGHAVARGDLNEAVWFARQLAAKEPITAIDCAEHDLALEFLWDFDHTGGFDSYVEQITDNSVIDDPANYPAAALNLIAA